MEIDACRAKSEKNRDSAAKQSTEVVYMGPK